MTDNVPLLRSLALTYVTVSLGRFPFELGGWIFVIFPGKFIILTASPKFDGSQHPPLYAELLLRHLSMYDLYVTVFSVGKLIWNWNSRWCSNSFIQEQTNEHSREESLQTRVEKKRFGEKTTINPLRSSTFKISKLNVLVCVQKKDRERGRSFKACVSEF